LLEHTTFFVVVKDLLELTLCVAETLNFRRDSRGRQVQHYVGAIHPVDMRQHRVTSTRGNILKAQALLDLCMKKLNRPAEPISHDDLACRDSHIIAGYILAATLRSFAWF
jgi:hypothetical protein